MKIIYLTNIPAPYRENFHELTYKKLKKKYSVIYCSKTEPNRNWHFKYGKYKKFFLNSRRFDLNGRYIYFNFKIFTILNKIKPKIIILNGLSPVMIFAFVWAKINNCKIIASTDVNILTEKYKGLSYVQKLLRKLIYPVCDAYLGASKKTLKLFDYYKANTQNKFFVTYYSYPTKKYKKKIDISKREYDIILCGQFIKRKKFDFSLKVIKQILKKKKNLKIKIIGHGTLKKYIMLSLKKMGVEYNFMDFVQPSKLIKEYSSAKIFIFPTMSDGWGVVANEACIAGTPVITCKNAGAANELIINKYNGLVLKLKVSLWAKEILNLLNNKPLLESYSINAFKYVKNFDSLVSSNNMMLSINYVKKKLL